MLIPVQWFSNKCINIKQVASCTLSFVLVVTPAAIADYTPGSGQKPVDPDSQSSGGTTRGCSGGEMPLTVLASQNAVGRTSSQHPTFAWFVPDDSASRPIEFTIYEWVRGGRPTEVRRVSLQSLPGVMALSPFSQNELGLELGKEYRWQVILHCDPDNPSTALVSEASIEIVELPAAVQTQLNGTADRAEKAEIYAEAGLWYDALAEALSLAEPSKLGEMGSMLLNDLVEWESSTTTPELSPQQQEAIAEQIETLEKIADLAR
ncbi:MAG: DUF928 domain-containing protein [Cyanobacteriota bacterium]|nr:DUF928 domain-containing protein [Cyanobacteriota bacterium]